MFYKIRMIFAGLFVSTAIVAASSVPAFAAPPDMCTDPTITFFGIKPWYACLPGADDGEPRIEALTDIFKIIFPVLEGLIKIAFLVAAAMMFFNIINYIRSDGNPQAAMTAIKGMRDAIVGLIITLVALPIVNFVAGAIL